MMSAIYRLRSSKATFKRFMNIVPWGIALAISGCSTTMRYFGLPGGSSWCRTQQAPIWRLALITYDVPAWRLALNEILSNLEQLTYIP